MQLRVIKMIISQIKIFESWKSWLLKETIKTTAAEIKRNYMTGVLVTLNAIPRATVGVYRPWCNFWTGQMVNGSGWLVYGKSIFELQQGNALVIMAKWVHIF